MIRIIYFIVIIFLIQIVNVSAQFHDNVWIVGNEFEPNYSVYKINFNKTPTTIENLNSINKIFNGTSSTYCDSLGNLLFYSRGLRLYNKENEIVEGGEIINPGPVRDGKLQGPGGYTVANGAFFLPMVEDDSKVLFIHSALDYLPDNFNNNYIVVTYHTMIDTKANNGKGKVLYANQPLVIGKLKHATACKHANGRDWWLLVADNFENVYYKFLLTKDGFESMGRQRIGSQEVEPWVGQIGTLAFSPDGKKFVDYSGVYGFSLYDFDRCSGELSNEYRLNHSATDTVGAPFDVAFSLNNRFLYTNLYWETRQFGPRFWDRNNPLVLQYDLNEIDTGLKADTVGDKGQTSEVKNFLQGIQLGPDGKIYSFSNTTKMHSIQEPNRKGKECNFRRRFPITEASTSSAHPYYPNYRLGPLDGSPCDTLGLDNHPRANYRWENWDTLNELHIEFADLSYYEPAEWFWEFEDLGTSRDTNPEFTFPAPGIYKVCLTVSNVNSTHTTCKNVPVGEGVVDIDYVFEENEPTVYPNPTSNAFQVYLPTSQSIDVQLFDASGRQVLEQSGVQSGEQIDVSFLPKGIYFYHFRNEENEAIHTGRLVVVR